MCTLIYADEHSSTFPTAGDHLPARIQDVFPDHIPARLRRLQQRVRAHVVVLFIRPRIPQVLAHPLTRSIIHTLALYRKGAFICCFLLHRRQSVFPVVYVLYLLVQLMVPRLKAVRVLRFARPVPIRIVRIAARLDPRVHCAVRSLPHLQARQLVQPVVHVLLRRRFVPLLLRLVQLVVCMHSGNILKKRSVYTPLFPLWNPFCWQWTMFWDFILFFHFLYTSYLFQVTVICVSWALCFGIDRSIHLYITSIPATQLFLSII